MTTRHEAEHTMRTKRTEATRDTLAQLTGNLNAETLRKLERLSDATRSQLRSAVDAANEELSRAARASLRISILLAKSDAYLCEQLCDLLEEFHGTEASDLSLLLERREMEAQESEAAQRSMEARRLRRERTERYAELERC